MFINMLIKFNKIPKIKNYKMAIKLQKELKNYKRIFNYPESIDT